MLSLHNSALVTWMRQKLGLARSGAAQFAARVPTPGACVTVSSPDIVSWPIVGSAQRANCAAPERVGTDRRLHLQNFDKRITYIKNYYYLCPRKKWMESFLRI